MLKVVKSTVVNAPIESVWEVLRDFNGHSNWHSAIRESVIVRGQASDKVGCIREFSLHSGEQLREQLLTLSDLEMSLSYCLLETPLPLFNYVAHLRLFPITDGNLTFWEWESSFSTRAGEEEQMKSLVGDGIYQAGFASLKELLEVNPAHAN